MEEEAAGFLKISTLTLSTTRDENPNTEKPLIANRTQCDVMMEGGVNIMHFANRIIK